MFKFIAEELAAGKRLVAATVVSRVGSGPRDPGAMMVVAEDGRTCGTVGGGLLEAQTLEAAKSALLDGEARLLTFDLNRRELSDAGMVCGGRVEILVDVLSGRNPDHVRMFGKLADALYERPCLYLLTSILVDAGGAVATGRGAVIGDDFDCAGLAANFRQAAEIRHLTQSGKSALTGSAGIRCFVQAIARPLRVFIAGAGHIGQALAAICSIAGFQAVVLDNRPEYANTGRFPDAVVIKRIDRYADALKSFSINASDTIVIATHSHLADRDVLAAALQTQAGYIGMIASRRKRDMIYSSLSEEGFTPEKLARVHSPAGLDIGAQTPAEIAVSIAAELIAVCNQKT